MKSNMTWLARRTPKFRQRFLFIGQLAAVLSAAVAYNVDPIKPWMYAAWVFATLSLFVTLWVSEASSDVRVDHWRKGFYDMYDMLQEEFDANERIIFTNIALEEQVRSLKEENEKLRWLEDLG